MATAGAAVFTVTTTPIPTATANAATNGKLFVIACIVIFVYIK